MVHSRANGWGTVIGNVARCVDTVALTTVKVLSDFAQLCLHHPKVNERGHALTYIPMGYAQFYFTGFVPFSPA